MLLLLLIRVLQPAIKLLATDSETEPNQTKHIHIDTRKSNVSFTKISEHANGQPFWLWHTCGYQMCHCAFLFSYHDHDLNS